VFLRGPPVVDEGVSGGAAASDSGVERGSATPWIGMEAVRLGLSRDSTGGHVGSVWKRWETCRAQNNKVCQPNL